MDVQILLSSSFDVIDFTVCMYKTITKRENSSKYILEKEKLELEGGDSEEEMHRLGEHHAQSRVSLLSARRKKGLEAVSCR